MHFNLYYYFLSLSLSFVWWAVAQLQVLDGSEMQLQSQFLRASWRKNIPSNHTKPFFYLGGFSGTEHSLLPFPPAHSDPLL